MAVIVTGGTGAMGFHLLNSLTRTKGKLISFSDKEPYNFRHLNHVRYETGDVLNFNDLCELIKKHQPKEIYHLASQGSVGVSHSKPYETLETNVLGTQNVLEAIRRHQPKCKVLLFSSSDIYGSGKGLLDVMHTENDAYRPLTPFATSKASMEMLGIQHHLAWGTHVCIARPFNYSGPGQNNRFVIPNIAEQLVKINEYAAEPVIYTGNLEVSRDILDMRDIARALGLIMSNSHPGEIFNICSERIYTIRDLVDRLIHMSGEDIEIRKDPQRMRAFDQPLLMGSAEKLTQRTGWKPMIAIEDTLRDVYKDLHFRLERELEN